MKLLPFPQLVATIIISPCWLWCHSFTWGNFSILENVSMATTILDQLLGPSLYDNLPPINRHPTHSPSYCENFHGAKQALDFEVVLGHLQHAYDDDGHWTSFCNFLLTQFYSTLFQTYSVFVSCWTHVSDEDSSWCYDFQFFLQWFPCGHVQYCCLLFFCLKHTLLGDALYRPLIDSKAQIQPPPASAPGVGLVWFVLMHQLQATVILVARLSRSKSAPGHTTGTLPTWWAWTMVYNIMYPPESYRHSSSQWTADFWTFCQVLYCW